MLLLMVIISFISLLVYPFYIAYQNTKDIVINDITISSATAHKTNQVFNVLQISDMHLENISISSDDLYSKLKNKKIDMISLTGDFLDRKRSIPKLIPYLEVFQKLKPEYGVYAVFGNHDYVLRNNNFELLLSTLQDYGCKVMQNENETIMVKGTPVNIIGIDDYSTKKSDLTKSYLGLPLAYNLVLTHDPNIVLDMKEYNFDYLLSGHFHGGQIHWPKPYHLAKMGKLVRMNMVKGLQSYDNKKFYISEGLGQTGVNIRVGSRPEITIHNIDINVDEKMEATSVVV
jgi:predicted MPP superfamily phosphohydrolase